MDTSLSLIYVFFKVLQ